MLTITNTFLAVLFALLPNSPNQPLMDAARDSIAQQATEAANEYEVPITVLLVVGYAETHLGTDHGSGGNWGAPIDGTHRHTAGTARSAARILRRGMDDCPEHTWRAAITRFRSGLCTLPADDYRVPYVRRVTHLIEAMHTSTSTPLPIAMNHAAIGTLGFHPQH